MLKVATCQIALNIDDQAHNRRRTLELLERAASSGAGVVVLPELVNSGYCFNSAEEARSYAITDSDPFIQEIAQISDKYQTTVVAGLNYASEDGNECYSSAVIISNGITVGIYHKTHLWNEEHRFFTPGSDKPLVVSTKVGKIAAAICYDIEFPETVRYAAEEGACLLAAPVNWPANERPPSQPSPIETVKAMAAASQYRIGIAIADRVGAERGTDWEGGSNIISHEGWPIAEVYWEDLSTREQILVSAIDTSPSHQLNNFNHALNDRRIDLY